MKKILVTGGAGFIGSYLADRLLASGNFVIVVDNFDSYYDPEIKKRNLSKAINHKNFILLKSDLLDTSIIKNIIIKYSPTHVVHLAAKVGVRNSITYPHEYINVNILGTLNLLEAVKNRHIKNFIFTSSSSVYGNSSAISFSERQLCKNLLSPYAVSKRSAELLCEQYSNLYKIPITVLRLFSVYGPNQRPDLAIARFINNIKSGKEIEIYGNGKQERDFTYVNDIVNGVMCALDKTFNFEIINLGNAKPVKINTILSILEKLMNKQASKKFIGFNKYEMRKTYADISKARKLLNWNPGVNIEKGLKCLIEGK